ncbi:hypothetical protein GCM10022260_03230 [Gaetbulibacter aestuarii]
MLVILTSKLWYDFFFDKDKKAYIKSQAKVILKVDFRNVRIVLIANLDKF